MKKRNNLNKAVLKILTMILMTVNFYKKSKKKKVYFKKWTWLIIKTQTYNSITLIKKKKFRIYYKDKLIFDLL